MGAHVLFPSLLGAAGRTSVGMEHRSDPGLSAGGNPLLPSFDLAIANESVPTTVLIFVVSSFKSICSIIRLILRIRPVQGGFDAVEGVFK